MNEPVVVRALTPGDVPAIEQLFDDTLLLGAALDRLPVAFDHYRRLSLGWYLGPGRGDSAVAVDARGTIVGYTLVCLDEAAAARWSVRTTLPLAWHVATAALRGRLDRESRRFYRSRLSDAGALLSARRSPPASVHAHLNVRRGARTLTVSRQLADHVDARCRAAGHAAWYGEVNERAGSRRRALERLGADIVGCVPNRTLTTLLGEPVQRLTLLRRLDGACGSSRSPVMSVRSRHLHCDDGPDQRGECEQTGGAHGLLAECDTDEDGADGPDAHPDGVGGSDRQGAHGGREQHHAHREGDDEPDGGPQPTEAPGFGEQRRPDDLEQTCHDE